MFRDDHHAGPAKKVPRELEALGLPTLSDIEPRFNRLCEGAGGALSDAGRNYRCRGDGSIGRATNHITKDEYGSCAISEHFVQPGGGPEGGNFVGGSYSTYDALTKSWRQMWVDNAGGMFDLRGGPVTGQRHRFQLTNIEPRGPKKAPLRMIWEDVSADNLTWRWQKQKPDSTWTDLWVLG
jgi:hypothetical protein